MRERLDTGHAYRVQRWALHTVSLVAVVQGLVIVMLVAWLWHVYPLKEVVPMLLVGGSRDDQVWRVEPFEVGTRGWDLIAQKQAEKYVVLRESIDLQTEVERWQEVAWLSSDEVFREFRDLMGRSNSNSPFERAKRDRLTRTVTPHVTTMLNERQIQVEFTRRDFHGGEEVSRAVLVATMTIDFLPAVVRPEDRYMNPTGWTVVAYGLAEKSQ